jgi:hypothetical protein
MGSTAIFLNASACDNLQLCAGKIYRSCDQDHRSCGGDFVESF